jgi:hypothetical protein
VWVKKDLVQRRAFSQEDCFPVGRERLPIPTEISFSRDLWSEKTGKASFADIVRMAGGGRGVVGVVRDEGLGKLSRIRDRSKGSLQRLLKLKAKVKHRH